MSCDALSFSGVDESKWATIREAIERDYGMRIDSEQGEARKRGFTLTWEYDSREGTLEIQCLGKPLFIPCSVINGYISNAAAKSGVGGDP